jgi:hypothetical protein
MKQTAVEWLENQIKNSKHYYSLMKETKSRGTIAQPNIFEQAKEMEKEQIKDAWDKRGDRIVPKYFLKENITGEQYYNQTYNSEQ